MTSTPTLTSILALSRSDSNNNSNWKESKLLSSSQHPSESAFTPLVVHRPFHLQEQQDSFDDKSMIDVKGIIPRDGDHSPCTVVLARFWETDSNGRMIHHSTLPSSSWSSSSITPRRRPSIRNSRVLQQQEQAELPQQPILSQFQVCYHSSRWALLVSSCSSSGLEPSDETEPSQLQQEVFQTYHCTFIVVQRATEPSLVDQRLRRQRPRTEMIRSPWWHTDESEHRSETIRSTPSLKHILVVVESKCDDPTTTSTTTSYEDEPNQSCHTTTKNKMSSANVWAQTWAQNELGNDFTAVYTLSQPPTSYDDCDSLEQPMLFRLIHDDGGRSSSLTTTSTNSSCSSTSSTIGEKDETNGALHEENIHLDNNHHQKSQKIMILSRPFHVDNISMGIKKDGNDPIMDKNITTVESVAKPTMDPTHIQLPDMANGGLMSMLTEEGALSNLSRASSVMIHLCCSDHVTMHDKARQETLIRLYRQFVQHAVQLNYQTPVVVEQQQQQQQTTTTQLHNNNHNNNHKEWDTTLDSLGKISWILLQTGNVVTSAPTDNDQLTLLQAFAQREEEQSMTYGTSPLLTLQEYFAARFLARSIGRGESPSSNLDFIFRQENLAVRYDNVLVHVARQVCRHYGMEGIKSLVILCRRNSARDILGVHQLCLELRLVHEWLISVAEKKTDLELGLSVLEAEFHMLESFQTWFKTGVALVQRECGRESSQCLLSFLMQRLKTFQTVLKHIPTAGYVEPLLQACDDENDAVRRIAAASLVEIATLVPDAGCVDVLVNLCKKHECARVRHVTIRALAKVAQTVPDLASQCLSTLLTACKDASSVVRVSASTAVADVAVANSSSSLPVLLSVCKSDRNEFIRTASARAIGLVVEAIPATAEESIPTLVDLCETDRRGTVRSAATAALAQVSRANSKAAVLCLRVLWDRCKNDRCERVRQAASVAIAELGKASQRLATRCLRYLIAAGKDENKHVRKTSVGTLGDFVNVYPVFATKCHGYIADVCKMDRSEAVRQAAAQALGEVSTSKHTIASKCCMTLIYVAREDKTESVRKAAVIALGLASRAGGEIASRCLAMLVETCLGDTNLAVRKAAAQTIGMQLELSERFAVALVKHCLQTGSKIRGKAAACVLAEIAKANPDMADCVAFHLEAQTYHAAGSDRNGNKFALMEGLEPCPEFVQEVTSSLLLAYQLTSLIEIQKAATYFLGEVADMEHAQQSLPLFLLDNLGKNSDHRFCEPLSCVMRSLSIEQLITNYWVTRNDAMLPLVAECYFQSALFACTSRSSGDQPCLAVYNKSGIKVEWEEDLNHTVQRFSSSLASYLNGKRNLVTCDEGSL